MSVLNRIFNPRGIAVVGASKDPGKRGYQAIRTLQEGGFPYAVYPVNPRLDEVLGLRAYPNVRAIPGAVDLALIVVPPVAVPSILEECADKGIAGAVVIAVGFGEAGPEGVAMQRQVSDIARRRGIRVVGPNTSGIFNLSARLNLVGLRHLKPGGLSLITQSGNMLLSLAAEAEAQGGPGFNIYVGVGNEADLGYHDYLAHLREDPETHAVAIYCEGFRDGRAALCELRRLARHKPVVVFKAGRTSAGREAALTHTGALAGDPEVAVSVLRQAGAIVADRSDELLAIASGLMSCPPSSGPRVAVLADGGGHATIAVDALAAARGTEPAVLSPLTSAAIAKLLPASASPRNPVDVAGATDREPSLLATCCKILLADPAVDMVLVVGLFGGYHLRFDPALEQEETQTALEMIRLGRAFGKPVIVHSAYARSVTAPLRLLAEHGIPIHESIEMAVSVASALGSRARWTATAEERSDLLPVQAGSPVTDGTLLSEPQARELLERAGVDTGAWFVATDEDQIDSAAAQIPGPLAMKIVSADISHKSDVGGVRLNVSRANARTTFRDLLASVGHAASQAALGGVLVAPMAPQGTELLIGAVRDPCYGPLVSVGAGGTLVEAIADVSFRAAPLRRLEALEMLAELRSRSLLDGIRGLPPIDRDAVADLLVRVGNVIAETSELVALDLNPVIVHRSSIHLVDVRATVRS